MLQQFPAVFCLTSMFKPAKLVKLKSHLQIHFNKAVVCGVHLVLGAPFDFTSCDIPIIQRWWTLILLDNFGVFSERNPTRGPYKWITGYACEEIPVIPDRSCEMAQLQQTSSQGASGRALFPYNGERGQGKGPQQSPGTI
ncbi:hypothetical protein cypCar_00043870 [Cyprinus carpio]|nr:hypothetical protein cypCar_00043870 [Cyprinus carpio]